MSKLILQETPEIKLVGQAADTNEAFIAINELKPQLIFLDIMMRDETGFDLLQRFNNYPFDIIFTTAYNEFAIKAFKYNAIDYLLKPVDRDELRMAVTRAKERVNNRHHASPEQMEIFFQSVNGQQAIQNKIAVPTSEGFEIIELDDILYCQSSSSYTYFHLHNKRKLISSYPLKQYDDILSERNFFRAHKSFLINLSHVKLYRKGEGGTIVMSDGEEIEVSRRNKEALIKIFKP
ncbi:LytR/AlgR family response regulator transcription factor [Lacibacter sp. MH-610]|uniref:LytR/AlgR family response regulator transcription factor n=1 Tax=Lacibacter sp. MH-610 TaxID=3020883 RepID=UPI003892B2B0